MAPVAGEGFDGELGAFEVLLDEEVGDLGVVPYGGLRPGRAGPVRSRTPSPRKPARGSIAQGKPMRPARKGDQRGASAADEREGPVDV